MLHIYFSSMFNSINVIVNLCKKLFLKRWSVVLYLLLYIMLFVIVKVEDFLKLESQSGIVV